MELSIQERLKDLRVERGLTLEQLEEQVNLSKSALGSYEAKDFKDISHYAIIKLAKFYGVAADYLLGLSQTRNHPNADLADLRLSDDMIELLKSGLVDNSLLCELAVHPDFPRLMADLEIYVNGVAGKQVQSANAIVDAVSATIMKQHNPGLSDPQLRQLIAAHIDDDSFCRYAVYIDFKVSHEPGKIRVRRQFTQEGIIHQPAFQKFNHIITQTQVCKIGVWVIFCFRTAQQIINGHFVKLCQLDKGIVADVLELVPLIAA